MEGREFRRSVTLSEQLALVDSHSLRDLLRVRDEDEVRPSSAVVACEKREAFAAVGGAGSGRTLLDIIREEHEGNGIVVGGNSGNGINWKTFKDCLRLRRAVAAWASPSSSVQPNPIADHELLVSIGPNPVLARSISRSISVRISGLPIHESTSGRGAITEYNPTAAEFATAGAATSPPEEHTSEARGGGEPSASVTAAVEQEQPVRVSLMALLEQADRQWGSGSEGSSPKTVTSVLVGEENEAEDGGGMFYVCCGVCMVRNKGAAFIPCGHTFCRLCSRELWVSRGNCPLCNGFILEILDIF